MCGRPVRSEAVERRNMCVNMCITCTSHAYYINCMHDTCVSHAYHMHVTCTSPAYQCNGYDNDMSTNLVGVGVWLYERVAACGVEYTVENGV